MEQNTLEVEATMQSLEKSVKIIILTKLKDLYGKTSLFYSFSLCFYLLFRVSKEGKKKIILAEG